MLEEAARMLEEAESLKRADSGLTTTDVEQGLGIEPGKTYLLVNFPLPHKVFGMFQCKHRCHPQQNPQLVVGGGGLHFYVHLKGMAFLAGLHRPFLW
jgi:hypothetical protein